MAPPTNLITDALLLFYFVLQNKRGLINIKRAVAVSHQFKRIITNSRTYLNTRLYMESFRGDVSTVEYLLNRGASYYYMNLIPLSAALRSGNIPVARHYISRENIKNKEINEEFLCELIKVSYNHLYLIKEYINSRAISDDIIHDMIITPCILADSIELFNLIWTADIIDWDISSKVNIMKNILNRIIRNSHREKLFKYIMETPELNKYIYANPIISDNKHILILIAINRKYNLYNYFEISKFKKSIKVFINCMQSIVAYGYGDDNYKFVVRLINYIFDNYKKLNYKTISHIIIDIYLNNENRELCEKLIDKFITTGAPIEELLYTANRWSIFEIKEYIYSKITPAQIEEMDKQLFARAIKEKRADSYIRYVKLSKALPDDFMNYYIDALYR